ncbi:MAG: DNA polymerase III subunit beta [Opitutaceae bacterium]|nr:DNA polymerase III subunit beta [Opitutaceae bacterium]
MKLSINRSHLETALARVLSVVSGKTSLPILSHVLMEAEPGQLTLTATNLDLTIRCRLQAEVTQKGAITLPAKRLAAIVRELPQESVEIDVSANLQARIQSGASRFRVPGAGPLDFPAVGQAPAGARARLKQTDLNQLLREIAYAQSKDEVRYVLNGALLEFKGGVVNGIATDGRRLAKAACALTQQPAGDATMIVPGKTVTEILRLLGAGESVGIAFDAQHIAFGIATEQDGAGLIGEIELLSKLIQGNFPNYRQVIPKEGQQKIRLSREGLREAVHRVALVCTDKANIVGLKFTAQRLEITACSPDIGEARESLAIEFSGAPAEIGVNPLYLLDPLGALEQDEITLGIKDGVNPLTIQNGDFTCVIMPVRLT